MLIQYSPSTMINNLTHADGQAFITRHKEVLEGFDDITPINSSFNNKHALLHTSFTSTVSPLQEALMELFMLMREAALAYGSCDRLLQRLDGESTPLQSTINALEDTKMHASKARLSFAKILPSFNKALGSTGWAPNDAAYEFDPKPQSDASQAIARGYRISAQRSTAMLAIKRTYEEAKEVGDATAEESLVSKKRKFK